MYTTKLEELKMPGSSREGKEEIKEWILNLPKVNRVLDLAVGKGNYKKFFTKRYQILNNAEWIGIEIWEPYIEQFKLRSRYTQIVQEDIRKVDYQNLGKFDIVFAGDVLEHMTKEEAIEVVEKVLEVNPILFISIPIVHYPQGAYGGNPYEIHVKDDWSHEEILETFPQIIASQPGKEIGVYMLKGNA